MYWYWGAQPLRVTLTAIQMVLEIFILAQAALRAPPEVALQCVAGHCYYHRSFLGAKAPLGLACVSRLDTAKKFQISNKLQQ